MNWKLKFKSPLHSIASKEVHDFLIKKRIINYNGNLKDLVISKLVNKTVLDIGVCEHDLAHIKSENWAHGKICKVAKSCVGVDILPELVNKLNVNGYNVLCVDATSNKYLGKKFDIVNIGDVIEHVDDPVKLLKFAKRHIKKNGKIFVCTPNPYFILTILRLFKEETIVANLEHVSWITPSLALEISRRAGVNFENYYVSHPNSKLKKYLLWFLPIELKTATFVYVFS